ncbi:hypothetical protein SAMN02799630_00718 [Paenibacillus sp. UNCCL117]|uniref:glycan biosynthesis hexose transferase WsfD n=1 Tax=unclassified Paenibacillus TaxID=185978 RepID=UPI000890D3A5|nr:MULTISPECIES: hypothetical protein [unclassified Paenibacillus]SDC17395.1 hypothetical protein SAMN04488602_101517 [Paenibacillus sp. cl123]SFW18002.1 hypothetical protein SAMN02799630_00718 [Paenibacillus sp. UNCCL117]
MLEPGGKALSAIARWVSPAWAAAAGVFLITVLALFVPPFIGMADNGDYFRILYGNGLYFSEPDYNSQYLGYFVKQYGILQYYNENAAALFSSQSLFIRLALLLNVWLYDHQVFDLRVQAVIYTLMYTAAVYLLVEAVTWKLSAKLGYPIAAAAVFMFGDTGYTAYFNSFYSEALVLVMAMLLFASGLLLYRRRYNDYALLALFAASALLLTASKQQNAPVGAIVAVAGAVLVFIRTGRAYRILVTGVLAGLLAAGVGIYALIPKEFVNINKYHAMTRGVLMESRDPEAALRSFGIDEQFAALNRSIYYKPYSTVDVDSELLEQAFYSKYGFGSILGYYVTHPDQAGQMLNLAARSGFTIRPPAMGNYERTEGKPFGAQTTFFSGYSLLKDALAPKTFGFVIIWMTVVLGIYMPSFIAAVRARRARSIWRLPLVAMMMMIGLSGIFVSIIGAGDADLSKHEFLFTASFDLVTFVMAADLWGRRLWGERTVEGADEPAE